jgi:phospho-acceptor domain-containing protein
MQECAELDTRVQEPFPLPEVQNVSAFVGLMISAVRSVAGFREARVFAWGGSAGPIEAAKVGSGPADGCDDVHEWLSNHPEAVKTLHRGDVVTPPGLPANGHSGLDCLLLPMICQSLEGVLSIAFDKPLTDSALVELRCLCRLGAVVLADLREREGKRDELAHALHELAAPLAGLRGYTRLVLQGHAGAITDVQREYLSKVLENVERLVQAVAALRAGTDQ